MKSKQLIFQRTNLRNNNKQGSMKLVINFVDIQKRHELLSI